MSNIQEACDAITEAVAEFIQDYEVRGEDEDGRDGSYTPTDVERVFITEAVEGLLGDDVFIEIFNAWQDLVRKAEPRFEKQAVWERGRQAGVAGATAGGNPYAPWNESSNEELRREP